MRVPELQIVSDELWEAVKARQAEVRIVMSRDADSNAPARGSSPQVPAERPARVRGLRRRRLELAPVSTGHLA